LSLPVVAAALVLGQEVVLAQVVALADSAQAPDLALPQAPTTQSRLEQAATAGQAPALMGQTEIIRYSAQLRLQAAVTVD
jgi:hypothetical protein